MGSLLKWGASTKAPKAVWEPWYLSLRHPHRPRVSAATGIWPFLYCTITSYWGPAWVAHHCVSIQPLVPRCRIALIKSLRQAQVPDAVSQLYSSWGHFRSQLILAILWRLPVALRHGLRIESFSWYLYARKCMEKNTRNTSRVSCWVHLRSCLRTVCLPTSPNPIFQPRPILHVWTGLRAFISHSELGQGANLWPQPIGLSGCGFWWKTSKHDQHNHHVWNSWVWSSALRAGSYLSWSATLFWNNTGLDGKDWTPRSLCVYIHIYIYIYTVYYYILHRYT